MKKLFLFLLLLPALSYGQEPDTLDFGKCRLILTPRFTKTTGSPQDVIPVRVVSPSGKFIFYYYTSGKDIFSPVSDKNLNGINDYIDTIAVECDDIYKKQVLNTGISESGLDSIPVYFADIGGGLYGETGPVNGVTTISINSKIMGPKTKGMNMIRVTLAHEFHHVLHFRSPLWSTNSFLYYYEMSATFFEEVCYDSINDYRNYLETGIFAKTDVNPLHGSGGNLIYGSCLFFELIRDRYGDAKAIETAIDILPRLETKTPAVAMAEAVQKTLGISIQQYFSDFALATQFTKTNSKPDLFFKEGAFFPKYRNLINYPDTLTVPEFDVLTVSIPVSETGFNVRWIKTATTVYPFAVSNGNFRRFNTESVTAKSDTLLLELGPNLENGLTLDHSRTLRVSTRSKNSGLSARLFRPENNEIVSILFSGSDSKSVSSTLLFPNPFIWPEHDYLKVQFRDRQTNPNYQVLNPAGHVILEGKGNPGSNELIIPVKAQLVLGSGIYVINIFNGNDLISSEKLALIR